MRDNLTLLDVADHLLDKGVSVSGEATISVADVDLVYLGLDLVLASVEAVRRQGALVAGGAAGPPVLPPSDRASDGLARDLPGDHTPPPRAAGGGRTGRRPSEGPGAMSAARYADGQVAELRRELGRVRAELPSRVDVDPDDVERGLAKLVLTIVEFLRQLLERQAVRRMEAGSLTEVEVERVGLALMRLERKVGEMAGRFGLERGDLTLRLGPLGELL